MKNNDNIDRDKGAEICSNYKTNRITPPPLVQTNYQSNRHFYNSNCTLSRTSSLASPDGGIRTGGFSLWQIWLFLTLCHSYHTGFPENLFAMATRSTLTRRDVNLADKDISTISQPRQKVTRIRITTDGRIKPMGSVCKRGNWHKSETGYAWNLKIGSHNHLPGQIFP